MNAKPKGGKGHAETERNELIRARRAEGVSFTKIGKEFGVSQTRVIQICYPEKALRIEAEKRKRAKECGE